MKRRSLLQISAFAMSMLALSPINQVQAAEPEIFTDDATSAAVSGYDAVSYFNASGPQKGDAKFMTEWKGTKWQFSSAENLAAFQATPEKFAPQYGGYCAFAVSKGSTAPGDPLAWTVHDNKLYLNLSAGVQKMWQKDIPGNIISANANWPNVLQ